MFQSHYPTTKGNPEHIAYIPFAHTNLPKGVVVYFFHAAGGGAGLGEDQVAVRAAQVLAGEAAVAHELEKLHAVHLSARLLSVARGSPNVTTCVWCGVVFLFLVNTTRYESAVFRKERVGARANQQGVCLDSRSRVIEPTTAIRR